MPGLGALLTLCVLLRVLPLPATGLSHESYHMLAIYMGQSLSEIYSCNTLWHCMFTPLYSVNLSQIFVDPYKIRYSIMVH
jgi:hypothetical protein